MPLEPSPSPVASDRVQRPFVRRPLEAAWSGAAGVGALVLLALSGAAAPRAALLLAAAVALVSALLTRRALERAASERSSGDDAPRSLGDATSANPVAEAVERLEDPLLIVSAQEPDDLIARRVAYANAAAREMLRIPAEGALLVNALRHPEVLEAVDESLFGGLTSTAVYETGGARSRSWRAWSAPLPGPGGEGGDVTRHAVLVLRDETDVRATQRMSADFLANASHELRTPLASLSGFIETLRGHAKDDAAARARFLGIMSAQAERMARLVEDLLSLSRIELNEHVPPSGETDLGLIVRDVLDALAPQARAREVAIEAVGAQLAAPVEGDRDQILQVVQNLVDNALKYSPAGGRVTVEVFAHLSAEQATQPRRIGAARLTLLAPERSERRYALVRVVDSGPGIPREHLPRLTERFYRVEGQKSGDRSGTGLGLAIVKHVVNRHRGGLSVESLPGEGASFCAWFPEPAAKVQPLPVRVEARPAA